ncbi:hypothetical protein PanWU01x14_072390 [Parasponia andersonii]|uniref:Uncharacterized protein n=1 Tax=Parasponia andersonii TaxID=3476 RepID=A0A2P5DDR8_PARAD|nr:hypothetical protein PanWU01x14_072390 [Parasponia andersonii]
MDELVCFGEEGRLREGDFGEVREKDSKSENGFLEKRKKRSLAKKDELEPLVVVGLGFEEEEEEEEDYLLFGHTSSYRIS